ncbi:hypothetical protein AY601_2079 [Pedobacter cryoconitis]|uniref:Uncharacterized protein n=1 Tax=Pedobacter cryoconitis TaxID=188932 RepID=A0A127VCP0_9SPHI|nr:hypothetical protein [Pedobacter cryoconitis]AMP98980.1 hypothetical protein AY601_2079 [Pedobacter cryoconitis]
MGGFLGYIIGAVILLPLLLIGYNYFFINKNNADKYIVDYMTDSKEINLDIPHYTHSIVPSDELYKDTIFTTSLATKNMGRDGSRQTSMHYCNLPLTSYVQN